MSIEITIFVSSVIGLVGGMAGALLVRRWMR